MNDIDIAAEGFAMRPWSALALSDWNPRRHVDPDEIAGLAESIAGNGVIQNLVVRPVPGGLEICAGSKRWRAVRRLIETGRADPGFPMPVLIRRLSDRDALLCAMIENVQRGDMTPIEEADGFARLIEDGFDLDTIEARTGKSRRLISQRLVLHTGIAPEIRAAYEAGRITLGQAQAFTVGEPARQKDLLDGVLRSTRHYDAAEIRRQLLEKTVPLARAIFARDLYDGPVRRDLFGGEEHAEDRALFERLQQAAAEARVRELAAVWSWVELQKGGLFSPWDFEPTDGAPATAGAIVHLRDDLRVEIHTGLQRRAAAEPAPPRRRGRPAGDEDGSGFPAAHILWAMHEKTRRLQDAVAGCPAAAVSLAILGLLGLSPEIRIGVPISSQGSVDNDRLEDAIADAAARLSTDRPRSGAANYPEQEAARFRRALALPDADRLALLALLVARRFGAWPGGPPALGDSPLAVAVAAALGAATPAGWVLTTAYLERLSKPQLLRVAAEMGIADAVDAAWKRDRLIDTIALSDARDPAWFPPELAIAPTDGGGR